MTEQEQAAAADPRVGDRWTWQDSALFVVKLDEKGVHYDITMPSRMRIERFFRDRDFFKECLADWTLAARGPAKLKPERDPATQPVVGDEWTMRLSDGIHTATVKGIVGDDTEYSIDGAGKVTVPTREWKYKISSWRLHRKGDDPAWRPEGERSEAMSREEITQIIFDAKAKSDEAYINMGSDQPAAGIKVGDRVRNLHREEGVVKSKDDYGVKIQFDGDNKTQTFSFADVRHWLTIIPSATATDPDEQPEPIETIDRNPHTDPLVGDEWENGIDNTNRVVALSPKQVCCLVVQTDEFFILRRDDFAEESFSWRLSKAADAPGDDEPATPKFEGDPSEERFATYQPDAEEDQRFRNAKYIRRIRSVNGIMDIDVDVYEVLEAFAVVCPARAHAVKKLLCAGIRNKGSAMQDLREAAACVQRAMEMQHRREAVAAAKGKQ